MLKLIFKQGSMSRKKSESGSEGSSLSGSFRSTTTTDKSHPSEPSGMGSFNSKLSGGKKVTPPPTVRHMSDAGSVTTEVHKPSPLLCKYFDWRKKRIKYTGVVIGAAILIHSQLIWVII